MGDKYPDYWPKEMGGAYNAGKQRREKEKIEHVGVERSKYEERIDPYKKPTKFSYEDKPSLEEKHGSAIRARDICPMCHGRLYRRKGRYGAFLGCSNYPKCKYTKPL